MIATMLAEAASSMPAGATELIGAGLYPILFWLLRRLDKLDRRVDRLENHFGTKPDLFVKKRR